MAGSQPQFRVPVLLERLQFTDPRRSFFPVLAAIVVAVVFQLSVTDNDVTRLIEIALHSLVIMLALRAAGARRHVRRVALGLLVIFTLAAAIALFGAGEFGSSASRIISLILLLLTPLALIAGVDPGAAGGRPRHGSDRLLRALPLPVARPRVRLAVRRDRADRQ